MNFLKKKIAVVYVSRNKIEFCNVFTGKSPEIRNMEVYEWTEDSLPEIISKIKTKLGIKIRLLVANELSYTFALSIPKNTDKLREHLTKKISEIIPENVTDSDWDFKKIGGNSKEDRVVIFSPVKSVFRTIVEDFMSQGFKIEAMEPTVMAMKRNPNPVIGIALKTDIIGNDENVLNIQKNMSNRINSPAVMVVIFCVLAAFIFAALKLLKFF